MWSYCWKTLKKTKTSREMFCAHGLEELTLSKCPYYLKQSKVQGNPYQTPRIFFHRNRTKLSKKSHRPTKNLSNSQRNPEKKEHNCRHHTSCLWPILQNHGNQNRMVLAEKQIHGSVWQNREPRNKLTHVGRQRSKEHTVEKGLPP